MSDTLIRIESLSHRYGENQALRGIDLLIPRGSCFGLLGPNGAGKTTLLSLLTGLMPVQQGRVEIDAHDVACDTRQIKAISALVPQDYAFYLALSGRENLRFFADIYGLDATQWRARLDYCVQVCRLEEMLERRTSEYSGGMKRRLNLAIGLLNAPRILYLDEPTVGIDALSRQVVIDAIGALRAQGTTVIYTSHYMEEIEALCDELAIINHGQVVTRANTAELLRQGASKLLVLQLVEPPSAALLQALSLWRAEARNAEVELTLDRSADLAAVLAQCAAHGATLKQMQYGVSRLERIYLALLQTPLLQTQSADMKTTP